MNYFRLECAWPLMGIDDMDTSKVEKIVGKPPSDSGAGFGQRDVGWTYNANEEPQARAAQLRLTEAGYESFLTEYDE